MAAPVEIKVKTSAVASAITTAALAFGSTALAGGAPLPVWVGDAVGTVVIGLVTFAAGWLARHTPRNIADVEVDTTPPVIPPPAGPTTQS